MSRILFAAERLLPARGGAERFALELLGALAERGHDVRAVWLADGGGEEPEPVTPRAGRMPSAGRVPAGRRAAEGGASLARLPAGVAARPARAPIAGGYWADKAARRGAVAAAVAAEVAADRPDVVVTQLHAAPGALEAAPGVASVLLLPSYESLCKYAFDAGSSCGAMRDCVRCPRARALPEGEAAHLRASRRAHGAALAAATELLAPSAAVANAVQAWCGRRPQVAAWVAATPEPARARAGGHVLLAAAQWSANKGADLLAPLVGRLSDRDVVVTPAGLGADERRAIGAAGNVWFMASSIQRLLEGASVCLVPSRWPEPFGRVAFEAQAAGVPVLASAAGGLVEFVPEQALLPVDATADAWASAVRALEDREAWVAARGRALVAASAILGARPLERAAALVERAATTAS